jgi:hypothetical protein
MARLAEGFDEIGRRLGIVFDDQKFHVTVP